MGDRATFFFEIIQRIGCTISTGSNETDNETDNETLEQIEKLCAPSNAEQDTQRQAPVKGQTSQHEAEDEDAKKRGIKRRLATLASLKVDGDIDDAEYEEQRRRILNDI